MVRTNAARKRRPFSFKQWIDRDAVAGHVFILPFIAGLLVFTVFPFFMSLFLSFTDYSVFQPAKWIGFSNFRRMFFEDEKFWVSFWVTFRFAIFQVPIKLAFSLMVAVILSRNTKAIGVYRAAFYIPSLMGGSVAVALMWKQLFAYNGTINSIIGLLGLGPVEWLTSPRYALGTLISLGVWQFGSSMLIFLSSLKQIPETLYEAARVDGASAPRQFFSITLPLLTPTIFFNLVMQMINGFLAFTQCYIITQGKPMNSTLFYTVYMYQQAFEFKHTGYASALAWVMLLIVGAFTGVLFLTKRFWVYDEGA